MGGEITMLPDDLPEDVPSFVARFGTDGQCREYLFKARWPDGFRCSACGHDDAYQRVEETRLPSCGPGGTLTTSIAASVPVATTRMAATAPSAAVRSSRCADARARNSLGVPAPTRRRMTSPRL